MAHLKDLPGAHSDIQLYAHVRNLLVRLNNLCPMSDENFNPSSHALKINIIYTHFSALHVSASLACHHPFVSTNLNLLFLTF